MRVFHVLSKFGKNCRFCIPVGLGVVQTVGCQPIYCHCLDNLMLLKDVPFCRLVATRLPDPTLFLFFTPGVMKWGFANDRATRR